MIKPKKDKPRRGRPKTEEVATHPHVVQVRLSDAQLAEWPRLARASGHTHLGPWIRFCVEVANGRAARSS
jgi:hypothetical protein